MTIDELQRVHQANPFQPFTIHLTDGRRLAIPRAEFVSHNPSGKTVIVFTEDDSPTIFSLAQVESIQPLGCRGDGW